MAYEITTEDKWNCAKIAWDRAWSQGYVSAAITQHVGDEAADLLKGAVVGIAAGLGILLVGNATGSLAGAAIGAYFSAGNPAAAAAGAQLGREIGNGIAKGALTLLGIGFVVSYMVEHLDSVAQFAIAGFDMAANQAAYMNGAAYDLTIDLAARNFADAIGVLFALILAAIVLWCTHKLSQGKSSENVKELTDSKMMSLSGRLMAWLMPRLPELKRQYERSFAKSRFRVIEGGLPSSSMTSLQIAVIAARGLLTKLVSSETNLIKVPSIERLHATMKAEGFKLVKVEEWGPPGGKQLFYTKGNVLARFKTMGDAKGPRANQPHLSAGYNDGKGFDWQNDLAKFGANGKVEPKVISDPAKFDPKADFQGNPHKFVVLMTEFQMKVVDAWAGRTHFNTPAKFDMSALPRIVKEVGK
jgi:hypothetical protein